LVKIIKGIDTFKSISDQYAKDPDNIGLIFKMAKKYDDRFDPEKAVEYYKMVIAKDPQGKKGTTEHNSKKVAYTEYAEYSIGAMLIFSRTRDTGPITAFIEKYPESVLLKDAYTRLASFYRFYGKKEEALKFFEKYTAQFPGDPNALNAYVSRVIKDKNNLDRGIELSEKVKDLTRYNYNPSFMKNLAELHILKEDQEKAKEVYGDSFIQGRINNLAYSLSDYAEFWSEQGANQESAAEKMEMALLLMPDNIYLKQTAARIYLKMDRQDKALEKYGPDFIKGQQDKSDALSSYARFWAGMKKNLESALQASLKSVELDPSHYKYGTMSLVYSSLEKHAEALKAVEKAAELAGKDTARYQGQIAQIKKKIVEKKN